MLAPTVMVICSPVVVVPRARSARPYKWLRQGLAVENSPLDCFPPTGGFAKGSQCTPRALCRFARALTLRVASPTLFSIWRVFEWELRAELAIFSIICEGDSWGCRDGCNLTTTYSAIGPLHTFFFNNN